MFEDVRYHIFVEGIERMVADAMIKIEGEDWYPRTKVRIRRDQGAGSKLKGAVRTRDKCCDPRLSD